MTILDLTALADVIVGVVPPERTLIVGIDGPGGSGKSTLGRLLGATLGAVVVEGDDFYWPSPQPEAPDLDGKTIGSNFDWRRLRDQVIAPAAARLPVRYQRYDWDNDQLGVWVEIAAGAPIVIEGLFVTRPEIRHLLTVRIWVETPRTTRLARGLARDGEKARTQWEEEWMPEEDRYVEQLAPASHCEFVVDGSGSVRLDASTRVVMISWPRIA
jgi:uridine kinase